MYTKSVTYVIMKLSFYMIVTYICICRCAVGDLSGKNGQVTIRAEGSPNRTLVATDSNLPLLGRYTGNQS